MSSKNQSEEQKRMTSITRKLHWSWIRTRFFGFLAMDVLLYCISIILWCLDQEFTRTGTLHWALSRRFTADAGSKEILYVVTDPEKGLLFEAPFLPVLITLSVVFGVLFMLQLLGILFSYMKEDRKIRGILAPINEIALKADELSRLSFSEDKYQVIENALDNIKPGEAVSLSFHDSDLSGVEAAMNNMLLRMRESYRQQARFVNDASHELRTPIAVIQGYANMLDRWGKTDSKILDESILAIRNESTHMGHLVEQLLFLARGDSGRTPLNPERVSLNSLIQEIYEESVLIDEDHRYLLQKSARDVYIMADPGLLKQAVRILTDNASKYTKKGDEIRLSCGVATVSEQTGNVIKPADSPKSTAKPGRSRQHRSASYTDSVSKAEPERNGQGGSTPSRIAWLQVQDTGIGMSGEDVRHMFERFYRSDEVRSYAGTGLGLSIAKWIVDRHQGHFEILSRTGLGTRVRICLPAESS